MKRALKLKTAVLSMTISMATLALSPAAYAQFNIGGIRFDAGSRGGPSFSFNSHQSRPAVEPAWHRPAQDSSRNRRYREPGRIGAPAILRSHRSGRSIDAHTVLQVGLAILGGEPGTGVSNPYPQPTPCPISNPCPPPCETTNPVPVDPPIKPEPPTDEDLALQLTHEAQDAFAQQNYALATERMNQVVKLSPNSAAAYQFRALTYFAQGIYENAAADVYETLLRGPLWTWKTVYPLYGNTKVYVNQYTALARAAKQDQTSMAKHFLLAYHHLMLGHLEHGEKELQKVLAIQPNEPVTQQLLAVVQNQRNSNRVAAR